MIVVSTNGITDKLVFAEGALKKFTADLSGKSEVPAVDTKATGTAQFQTVQMENRLIMNLM